MTNTGSLLRPYYDGESLKLFQSTLSCLYETSQWVGAKIGAEFSSRSWTMLDLGCGEGIFTTEMLSKFETLPQVMTALDPSVINAGSYRVCVSRKYPAILNIDATVGVVEDQIHDLPTANLVLASHSLYALLDQNRRSANTVLASVLDKARDGITIIIMASRDSYLYSIKKRVLSELHRLDKSSFAEDLQSLFPATLKYERDVIDTFVDVTRLLNDFDCLLGWLAYFCRVEAAELRPAFDMCQGIIRDTAIEVSCLPVAEQTRLLHSTAASRMGLTSASKIIYHKEVVYTIPSKTRMARPGPQADLTTEGERHEPVSVSDAVVYSKAHR